MENDSALNDSALNDSALNDSAFIELELTLSLEDAQRFVSLVDENDSVLPGLTGYYEVLYEENRSQPDRTRLMLYFPSDAVLPEAGLEILLASLDVVDYHIERRNIEKHSYLEAYKEHYRPFSITDHLAIVPSWHRGAETERQLMMEEGKIPLYLDPGLAFGTGQHPTTRLCLDYLDRNNIEDYTIIDAGTGSGILSIGALLLGASYVYAFDVDGNAIHAVRQNAEQNNLPMTGLHVETGGFELQGFVDTRADLMIANITANVLLSSLENMNRGQFPVMVLSGILADKKEEVIDAFEKSPAGWKCTDAREDDGWCLLEMKR